MSTHILIADDSASMRAMLTFTLKNAGYQVTVTVDGSEALQMAPQCRPALVITDLNMPRVDGIELIRCLRADPGFRHVPILMLTTESQDNLKRAGREAGATGWIVKPFNPEQLLAVVKRVLGN
ncbi:MAG TPA: response regulator [Candidatus Ozemobacteraceae bacterium]